VEQNVKFEIKLKSEKEAQKMSAILETSVHEIDDR
jgi:hypothetical protein